MKKTRKLQRIALITLAVLITTVALFYLEEDWRGKGAWAQRKAELEAKGVAMDWDKLIPPPVPDDQNFFTASTNILIQFKKPQTNAEIEAASKRPWFNLGWKDLPIFTTSKTNPLTVAHIIVLPPDRAKTHHDRDDAVVLLGEAQAASQMEAALKKTLGRSMVGAAGFKFSELQLSNLTLCQIWLGSETTPTIADLANLIPANLDENLGRLQVVATDDPSKFEVWLIDAKVTTAADYLKFSDQYLPAMDEMREALKRPYAILPGDYSEPYMIPIPNFVMLRAASQFLAMRAQCHLLLHDPDAALPDMTLIHDLCHVLQKPPTGKPETLVEAMINVAISGLYAWTIQDGFQLGEWREPQLVALQGQLKTIDLPVWVAEAFREEFAANVRTLESTPASKIADLFSGMAPHDKSTNIWSRLNDPLYRFLEFAPRGWIYQNLVNMANYQPAILKGFDLEHDKILPRIVDDDDRNAAKFYARKSPFRTLCAFAVPNYTKAMQVTACNQTLVNEGQIVCALERYRLKDGDYPAALDALVPSFIEKLPVDIIGGQPLHYRRTDDGKFLLYSVGWNEIDDGGNAGKKDRDKGVGPSAPDWVWPN